MCVGWCSYTCRARRSGRPDFFKTMFFKIRSVEWGKTSNRERSIRWVAFLRGFSVATHDCLRAYPLPTFSKLKTIKQNEGFNQVHSSTNNSALPMLFNRVKQLLLHRVDRYGAHNVCLHFVLQVGYNICGKISKKLN